MISVDYSQLKFLKKENIFNFTSGKRGLNVAILAGVHGNELSGILAIRDVVKNFSIDVGNVIFIICNQKAIGMIKRYIDENLNRCFLKDRIRTDSYEENIAGEIKEILDQCDICLDLHNSTSEKSENFIICEENALVYLDSLDCDKVVFGFDKNEPGGTDYYMNLTGKIGICVECGFLGNENIDFTINLILNFLKKCGNLDGTFISFNNKKYFRLVEVMSLTEECIVIENFSDFEYLQYNTVIGRTLRSNTLISIIEDSFVLFVNKGVFKPGEEIFLRLKEI